MRFSSMAFLWLFLPLVILGDYLITGLCDKQNRIKYKNRFLLSCSLVFYAWGGVYYVLIMLSTILINYLGGFFVNPDKLEKDVRKKILTVIIVLNLLILFVFKYFNMCIAIIESVMEHGFLGIFRAFAFMEGTGELGLPQIILPIGISFFTFQSMSYVIDVYNGKARVQGKLLDFALYVSFFPQLIAGPIVKYSDIAAQLKNRPYSSSLRLDGQRRFVYGLAKKVIIANTLGDVADKIWALETGRLGAPIAWLGLICYTFQIYYDFSGYSDMAIGLGKMLGFSFKENFNYPYTATSVQDFWRRWHISLSSWFREYVYIPLGGNREGIKKTCINIGIVFLLTGFWHGANFTFVLWGLFFALLLIIERLGFGKILKANPIKPLNWLYTMFMVSLLWVLFRSDNIAQAFTYIGQLFAGGEGAYSIITYLSMKVIVAIIAAFLLSGFVQRPLKGVINNIKDTDVYVYSDFVFRMILLVICIFSLVGGSYNAFIYFQF